jgi:hypothetical protein
VLKSAAVMDIVAVESMVLKVPAVVIGAFCEKSNLVTKQMKNNNMEKCRFIDWYWVMGIR